MEDLNNKKIEETTCEETSESKTEYNPVYSSVKRDDEGGAATIEDFDYQTYERVEKKATQTSSVTALVLGICSIVADLFFGLIGLILGVIGVVFAVKAKKTEDRNSMATAGMVCSIIGIAFAVIKIIVLILVIVGLIVAGTDSFFSTYNGYF